MSIRETPSGFIADKPKRLIKPREAYARIGISRATGERRVVEDPDFPKKVHLGLRSVAFLESDVDAYIDRLVAKARSLASTSSHRQSGQPASAARSMSAFGGAA